LILSASGMATGGRVLFHLENMLSDSRNMILFSGFQAAGTRGADLVGGAKQIKFHGRYLPVEAEVMGMHSQSAHADQAGLVKWLGTMKTPPKRIFLVHGEPQAADTLRRHIGDTLGWPVHIPEYREEVDLTL
jgi:metallo-beta-lactamase family protein